MENFNRIKCLVVLVSLQIISSQQTSGMLRFTPQDASDHNQVRYPKSFMKISMNNNNNNDRQENHNSQDSAASFGAPELAMTNASPVLSDEMAPIEIISNAPTSLYSRNPIYRNQELEVEPRVSSSHNIENAKVRVSAKDMATAAGHHHHHGHYPHGWLKMGAHTGKKGSFGWHAKYPVGGKGRR